ncbi:MAG: hypothetical protein FWF38_02875, partial [Spirochaetaceae bacterium]|nr:hypothetical protein [Spirochaetaceae bacterium]
IASSVVDPSKFTTIPIGVVIPIVTGVAVTPPNQSITSGSTLQFNAAVTGTNNPDPTVTWRVSSNVAGNGAVTAGTNINANGLLTSAPNETSPVLYIFATSVANPAISGSAYVTVIIPIVTGVVVSPPTQSAAKGTTLQFVASVTGSNNPSNAVTWRVSSNASGTGAVTAGTNINANGLLTIASNETAQILYILATSVANPARFGNASVTVTASASAPTTKPAGTGGPVVNPAPTKPSATTPDTTAPAPTKPSVTTPDTTAPAATNPSVTTPGTTTPAATNPSVTTPVSTPTVTNVTVASSTLSTRTNTTVQLSSSVIGNNNPNTAVTWKVSSNAAGTGAVAPGTSISSNGLLTVAPNEWATALYVFATSVADPTKSGSATVTIINNTETQGPNQGQAQPKQ